MRSLTALICLLVACASPRVDQRTAWREVVIASVPANTLPVPTVMIEPDAPAVFTMEYSGPWIGSVEQGVEAIKPCFSGPGVPICTGDAWLDTWCSRVFDFEKDGDVDQTDFGRMQARP